MMEFDGSSWWYSIYGINPEPWEAPENSVIRKNGKIIPISRSSTRLRHYEEDVAEAFKEQNPGFVFMGEAAISIDFYLWRNLALIETPSGGIAHSKEADATNCQKALEDALQGVLYKNDTNNFHVSTWIQQSTEEESFILIHVKLEHNVNAALTRRKTLLDPSLVIQNVAVERLGEERNIF